MYFSQLVHYVISSPPISASKPSGSQPPRSGSVVLEKVRSPWEWGFEHSLGSKICKNFHPPFGTLRVHCWAIHCKHHSCSSSNTRHLSFKRKFHDLYNIWFCSTNPWQYMNWRSTRLYKFELIPKIKQRVSKALPYLIGKIFPSSKICIFRFFIWISGLWDMLVWSSTCLYTRWPHIHQL